MLRLRLSDRSPIAVNIDGRFIERQTNTLTLDGLEPGLHRLEVYSIYGYRRRPVRIYTGTIRLQPGTWNTGWVDVRNRILRMKTRPMQVREGPERSEREDLNYERDRDEGAEESYRDDMYERGNDRAPDIQDEEAEERPGYGSFPRGRGNVSEPQRGAELTATAMERLRGNVSGKVTDTEKLKLLKSELDEKSLRTAQLRVMLGWLTFESSRLDLAKWAHGRVSDPDRYRQLEDVFTGREAREEFRRSTRNR